MVGTTHSVLVRDLSFWVSSIDVLAAAYMHAQAKARYCSCWVVYGATMPVHSSSSGRTKKVQISGGDVHVLFDVGVEVAGLVQCRTSKRPSLNSSK